MLAHDVFFCLNWERDQVDHLTFDQRYIFLNYSRRGEVIKLVHWANMDKKTGTLGHSFTFSHEIW